MFRGREELKRRLYVATEAYKALATGCEELSSQLDLARRKYAAADANFVLAKRQYKDQTVTTGNMRRKYHDACLRVMELEQECNQWAAQEPTTLTPYADGVTKYSRMKKDGD